MKNISLLSIAIIALSIGLAGFFIGNMHKTGIAYSRTVQVKGLSEREVPADLAVWPIEITLTGNDLLDLKGHMESQNDQLKDFFDSQGFSDGEFTRGSTTIQDTKADPYNTQYREFRYIMKGEFTIRTSDISKLKKALSESIELISEGVLISSKNTWQPVEYIFSGLNDLKPVMIEEATINARKVAEKFAQDSDSEVGKIMSARQGLFSISNRDQNTPEIKIIRVVSTIDYQLRD